MKINEKSTNKKKLWTIHVCLIYWIHGVGGSLNGFKYDAFDKWKLKKWDIWYMI